MAKIPEPTLEQLLDQWHPLKAQLDALVTQEKDLRQRIFAAAFPAPVEGTNKVKLPHGMALIGDYRLNYRIDKPALEALITADDGTSNTRAIFDRIISYRPEVKPGEFKKLAEDELKVVGEVITTTPGLPGLEIKPQSKVRW